MKNHNGFCSCSWCLAQGEHKDNRFYFSLQNEKNPANRTNSSAKQDHATIAQQVLAGEHSDKVCSNGFIQESPIFELDGFDLEENQVRCLHNINFV